MIIIKKKLWNFDDTHLISNIGIKYHNKSINDKKYSYSQYYDMANLYDTKDKLIKDILGYENTSVLHLKNKISEKLQDVKYYDVIRNRKSLVNLSKNTSIDVKLINDFCCLAFFGGKEHFSYPSGGKSYDSNIFFVFNEKEFSFNGNNIAYLDFTNMNMYFFKKISWQKEISKIFIQKEIFNNAKFAIFLSTDLKTVFRKYKDIGYKLVQQETGFAGESIQLSATALNLQSIPLQGFYDKLSDNVLSNNQSTLLSFLMG